MLAALLLALVAGCGDGDSDGSDGRGAATASPTAATSPTPTPAASPAACPSRLTVAMIGTDADLDFGASGIVYDSPLNDASFTVALTCPDAAANGCGTCTVAGTAASTTEVDPRRCAAALERTCTDATECDGGTCEVFLSPPLPLSAGGAPACVLPRIAAPPSGTFTPATGALDTRLRVEWAFYGALALDVPCPTCRVDESGEGRCAGGRRDGAPCEVEAQAVLGNTSFACPPNDSALLSVVPLDLDLTTATRSLAAASACTDGAGACYCPEQRRANDCTDGVCVIGADGEGTCASGPLDGQCEVETFRPCFTDDDCPAADDRCGTKPRECTGAADAGGLTAPLTLVGRADPERAELVSASCIPASSSTLQNQALGLPGPLALRLPATFCVADRCAP